MYDDLVKRMRICATEAAACKTCELDSNPSCTDELMKQAADAIEELQKAVMRLEEESGILDELPTIYIYPTKWIPVTERLPEEDGRYLTLYPLKTKPRIWRHKVYGFAKDLVEVDKYEFNEHKSGFYGYDGEYGYYEDKDVTHWMPLPEPPKEEN